MIDWTRRQAVAGIAGIAAACTPKGKAMFTTDGPDQVKAALSRHVDSGAIPNLVGLIARGDQTHVFPLGRMSLDAGAPAVGRDAIFRIASMTKPLTAVAAMMLIEEGKLILNEPVDRLAPELANRQVLRAPDAQLNDAVPARRPITLEDVMSFRLGWGVVFDDTPFMRAAAEILGFDMPNPASPLTPDSYMAALGKLPLQAQPGERWLYTAGSNILGVLVARAAGKPFEVFLQERVLGPLGMLDTSFYVPVAKQPRLVTGYMNDAGKLVPFEPWNGMYATPPSFPAGDSGLVSTAEDYAAFARFLQTGTTAGGQRLLSDESLRALRTDRLTAAQRQGGADIMGPDRSWGLGVGVYAQRSAQGIPAGAFGWDGGFGTSWFTDPASGLTAILLTQRVFDGPDPPAVHKDFARAAIAALA
jgi:CubicO group peptidase (beta-lactamase class C family)